MPSSFARARRRQSSRCSGFFQSSSGIGFALLVEPGDIGNAGRRLAWPCRNAARATPRCVLPQRDQPGDESAATRRPSAIRPAAKSNQEISLSWQ